MRSPVAALAVLAVCGSARAQQEEPRPWSLDLTVHDVGIGIGNSRHIDGLRLSFRDSAPFRAHGVNATIWIPDKAAADSEVDGLALGLPLTGAGRVRGLALGFGVAADKTVDGVAAGVLGAGCGGGVHGVLVGGLAAGSGGDVQGLIVGALAAGAGGTIQGAAIAALGVGAPRIQGLAAAIAVGGKEIQGAVVAPAYFHFAEGGRFEGVSVSAFNRVLGEQHGLAIGLVNYAARLHGVQIGLVNWADNNPAGLKVLPIANAHFE